MSTSSSPPQIRVLLIDDSPIIRLGLRSALEDYADIRLVGEAGTSADGLAAAVKLQPHVVMLDLHLPDKSGIETCRALRQLHPRPQVLILTSDGHERNVQAALQAGAVGYLLKENDGATLADALRRTAVGTLVMDRALSHRASAPAETNSAAQKLSALSNQERKVVALLSDGLTNKEIGQQLGLTEKTVKNYLAAIFTKLNIERRTQAAALHVEAAGQIL